MSGCRCHRGSSRTMLSRRCADDGGGLRLQPPARELALARAAGDVLAARSRSPSMCLAQTWHIPGVDLPRTPAGPAVPPAPGPDAGRGRSSRAAARTRSPSARRVAAAPTARPAPPPAQPQPPAIFRLTTAGPQLRHPRAAAVSDLDPDHAACSLDRHRDRLPRSARTAMPDAVPEQLAHQQSGVIPARMPGPGTPAVNARATRARSARPDAVTLSRKTALATSAPAFPGRPAARETTRDRSRAHGDARPARRPASSPGHAAGAARPWPSVKQPTVRTDRDGARIPSAMRPWTPRHVDPQ